MAQKLSTSFDLPQRLHEELRAISRKTRVPKARYVRDALTRVVREDLERDPELAEFVQAELAKSAA